MLKIELVWRELLFRAIEKKNPYFTLSELAQVFHLSTSLVSHAVSPLRELGIVEIKKTDSKVVDAERLLFYFATRRNLQSEVIYKTYCNLPIQEIETSMPDVVYPTAYSALRFYFDKRPIPADYDHCYFYAPDLKKIEGRFPSLSRQEPNIFILRSDPFLNRYAKTPLGQIFADLWNLPEWYAKEFNEEILLIIKERLGL